MTKHTPGPWKVSPRYAQRGKFAGHYAVHPEHGPAFAYMAKGRDDVAEANARLIAAAPELLAALKGLSDATNLIAGLRNTQVAIEARAAIAKAEGSE